MNYIKLYVGILSEIFINNAFGYYYDKLIPLGSNILIFLLVKI
jgi:hypothetical protein